MFLILSHFDQYYGPRIFNTIPTGVPPEAKKIVTGLMDISQEDKPFEFRQKDIENRVFYNYAFKISSDWARGGSEMLMLSVLMPKSADFSYIHYILETMVNDFKGSENIFMGFYDRKDDEYSVTEQQKKIDKILNKGYHYLSHKYEQLKIVDNLFEKTQIDGDNNTAAILKTIARTFITCIDAQVPEGAVLLYDVGSILAEKFQTLFISKDPSILMEEMKKFWKKHAFGEIDDVKFDPNEIKFSVYDCFECSHFPNINNTVCKFDEGFLTNLLETKLEKKFSVREVECYATGHDHCKFIVKVLSP